MIGPRGVGHYKSCLWSVRRCLILDSGMAKKHIGEQFCRCNKEALVTGKEPNQGRYCVYFLSPPWIASRQGPKRAERSVNRCVHNFDVLSSTVHRPVVLTCYFMGGKWCLCFLGRRNKAPSECNNNKVRHQQSDQDQHRQSDDR